MAKSFDEILDDVFDIRDVIERYEELESEITNIEEQTEEYSEFKAIETFLEEVKDRAGDEQWRGSWYPVTFIADDYFTEYAEELLKDIGDLPATIPSYIEIDWEATAENIKVDYSIVDINGYEYYYR